MTLPVIVSLSSGVDLIRYESLHKIKFKKILSVPDTGRAQPRDDDGFFESIQWRRWLRVIARRIGLGLRTYEDVEIKLQPCENWMDDVMRFLLLLTFAYQMVLFSLHYRSYRNKHGVQV